MLMSDYQIEKFMLANQILANIGLNILIKYNEGLLIQKCTHS